jgi:hypothetical protein
MQVSVGEGGQKNKVRRQTVQTTWDKGGGHVGQADKQNGKVVQGGVPRRIDARTFQNEVVVVVRRSASVSLNACIGRAKRRCARTFQNGVVAVVRRSASVSLNASIGRAKRIAARTFQNGVVVVVRRSASVSLNACIGRAEEEKYHEVNDTTSKGKGKGEGEGEGECEGYHL